MSRKGVLSKNRKSTIINAQSKRDEGKIQSVVEELLAELQKDYPYYTFIYQKSMKLQEIIETLKEHYPKTEVFYQENPASFISPDGGFIFVRGHNHKQLPILISEVKNQGTNVDRVKAGKKKQAQGNAIERLGKNVIGLTEYCSPYRIFPFACFGYGCDFAKGSTILDRVVTIARFRPINCIDMQNGSYFFREKRQSKNFIYNRLKKIAEASLKHYVELGLLDGK